MVCSRSRRGTRPQTIPLPSASKALRPTSVRTVCCVLCERPHSDSQGQEERDPHGCTAASHWPRARGLGPAVSLLSIRKRNDVWLEFRKEARGAEGAGARPDQATPPLPVPPVPPVLEWPIAQVCMESQPWGFFLAWKASEARSHFISRLPTLGEPGKLHTHRHALLGHRPGRKGAVRAGTVAAAGSGSCRRNERYCGRTPARGGRV